MATHICMKCQATFVRPGKAKFCSRRCRAEFLSGPNHPLWKPDRFAQSASERTRRWREANPDRVKKYQLQYDARRIVTEKDRERTREWRRNNPDRMRNNCRKYRLSHKELMNQIIENRRARQMNAPGCGVSAAVWLEILAYHAYRCAYCFRSDVPLTMDHVEALSVGGAHDPENIVPSCRVCNGRKGARGVLYMVSRAA
jgi:5-methylcytosine-specific restriction endonuclease McrA